MTRRRRWLFSLLATLTALAHSSGAHADQPWHKPFAASPADILAAAGKVAHRSASDIVVLLAETSLSFDEQGRATRRTHHVFRVESRAGADKWGTLRVSWSPWYQHKPTLRARVVSPDGVAHEVDPATVNEIVGGNDPHISSDRHHLEAPLPALTPGAVVEEESIIVDHRPYFSAGTTMLMGFGANVPVEEQRLVIDAPRSLKLRHRARLLPTLTSTSKRHGKRVRWTFSAARQSAHATPAANLPSDLPRYPHVALSTATSWQSVATAYAAIVDRQIGAGSIDDTLIAPVRAAAGRRARIDAALALVNDNVRYSGLELGASSITPWTPAQTWKRKYGDCKDKATLLVAILAKVGIDARVALLASGPGRDVDPDLPGMGSFDHAIVYLPGKQPLWIDPTAVFARAGELPGGDQDRLALVAHHSTRQLIRTPAASSRDNRIIERREVRLAEIGGGNIVETTTTHGWFDRDYRSSYRNVGKKQRTEMLGEWISNQYQSDSLTSYRHADVEDLSNPFQLRLEASGAQLAFTDEEEAKIFLSTYTPVTYLPDELKEVAKPGKLRKRDFILPVPYSYEIDYEIIPPPGFAPRPLPPAETLQLGPATLTASYRTAGANVIAELRFEIAKRRLVPAEVAAISAAVTALGNANMTTIGFEQVGMAMLARGEIKAAIAELCKLAKLHPKEALHRRQLALAYIAAGMGMTARTLARRAIELEPDSADAHFTLGWVLEHDIVGRHLAGDFDHAGAIAAYRRAITIAPKESHYHANLALVLERDRRGEKYAGDLGAAIAEYQEVRKLGESSYDINLMGALSQAGRWAALIDLARALPAEETRNAYLLTAIAARDGTDRARREATSLFPRGDDRQAALAGATAILMLTRRYADAAILAQAAIPGAANPDELRETANLLARTRPARATLSAAGTAERTAKEYFIAQTRGFTAADRRRLLGVRVRDVPVPPMAADLEDIPIEVAIDLAVAEVTFDLERSKWGIRVRARERSTSKVVDRTYLTRQGKGFAIVPANAEGGLGAFAIEALHWLDQGDVAGAKQWLQWAADALAEANKHHPDFEAFWSVAAPRTPTRLRLAAAAIAAGHTYSADRAIAILEKCPRDKPATTEACDAALYLAYLKTPQHLDDAAAVGDRVAAANCTSDMCWRMRIYPFAALGRQDEFERRAAEFVASQPHNPLAHFFLGSSRVSRGDSDGAKRAFDKAGALGNTSALNLRAWMTIVEDQPPDYAALFAAVRAVSSTQRKYGSILNTQAAVHAARGELELAYEVMLESMAADGVAKMRSEDWLVYAMIAAGYGLDSAALAALDKVTPVATVSPPQSLDVHQVAAHWRSKLAKKCKAKPAGIK